MALQQFEPATATINPDATRDLLKKLYQYLLPRRVRHDLGEFYTPDWLADRLIRQIGYDGNPNKRVLDASCGSGTILTLCIRKAFEYADKHLVRPDELVQKLLTNVVGLPQSARRHRGTHQLPPRARHAHATRQDRTSVV